MLLEGKVAVIYGAGGKVGGGVARAFACEGARVFLAGRTLGPLERVAAELPAGAGAGIAEVDALDAGAVDRHADDVVAAAGSIDVSFNLISHAFVQGKPLVEMSPEDYVDPVVSAVRSTFLTARATARHIAAIERSALLGRAATLEDVGNVAAFVASDRARTITGASINISAGMFLD